MQQCTTCGDNKPVEEFSWRNKDKGIRIKKCKSCQREYTNAHYQANKEKRRQQLRASNNKRKEAIKAIIWTIKSESGCVDCGESDPIVLDFDHLHSKEFNISFGACTGRFGLGRVLKEIEKCEVVCSNCHRRRTHSRRLSVNGCTPLL